MLLKVLGSSSEGNCYLLISENETLIIESGVSIRDIKIALDFDLSKVIGCIVTHEHQDHAKYVGFITACGIDVYASNGTHSALKGLGWLHRVIIDDTQKFKIGGFTISSIDSYHDAAQPLSFMIEHEKMGKMLFCTDSKKLPYKFKGLNHILIEANYSFDLIDKSAIRNRVFNSHMEIGTTIDFLKNNNLSSVNNIVLLHLSANNSDENKFKSLVSELSTANVFIANKGLTIELNKEIF